MTWRPDGNHEGGSETAKVRYDVVPYMLGRCLDLGAGPYRCFPHFISVDNGKDVELFGVQMKPSVWSDVEKLSLFASGEFDCVFSSHTLEHIDDYAAALKEWFRLVKVGGYLVLYLPHKDFYPRCDKAKRDEWDAWYESHKDAFPTRDAAASVFVDLRRKAGVTKTGELYAGTHWANPDHKHDFEPADIIAAMKKNGGGFDLVENEERDGTNEYSFFQVFKKIPSGVRESWRNPKPAKTAGIVRYGAIGDLAMASSIFPRLKEQGFHVTLYCSPGDGYEAIKHDPHVDRFILQGKDNVPPQVLGEFWSHTMKKYDRWINLSESVEGTFLACPDRVDFWWPNKVRAQYMDRNYLEFQHALAVVDGPYEPKFYATKDEQAWARKEAAGRRNVLWSLSGSSGHKRWPHVDTVVAAILHQYSDVHVYLVGDEACQIVEYGWQKEPRVHCRSGKWTIRQSMAFAEAADLIIGTETGLLNAAGVLDVPKIITLSHSSEEMLTKHWKRVTVLKQPDGEGCPKRWKENGGACRQLHGGSGYSPWVDCPEHEETGTAMCQFHVSPDAMWQAVRGVLGAPVALERRAA